MTVLWYRRGRGRLGSVKGGDRVLGSESFRQEGLLECPCMRVGPEQYIAGYRERDYESMVLRTPDQLVPTCPYASRKLRSWKIVNKNLLAAI